MKQLPGNAPPQISFRTALKAAIATAASELPVISAITKWVDEAEQNHRAERIAAWSEELAGDAEPHAFASQLADALEGPEGELVRAAILESIRSVTDAIDSAVIPSIARLSRRYLMTRTPDVRMLRKLLAMLTTIDAETLEALRGALRTIQHYHPRGTGTCFIWDTAPQYHCWNWYMVVDDAASDGGQRSELLLSGDIAHRVVAALLGESQNPFANEATLPAPRFTLEMLDLMIAIV